MEPAQRIIHLLDRYESGTLTLKEWAELSQLAEQEEHRDELGLFIDKHWELAGKNIGENTILLDETTSQQAFRHIRTQIPADGDKKGAIIAHRTHLLKRIGFRYTAAVLLICCVGIYLWLQHIPSSEHLAAVPVALPEIEPGKAGAILTLNDGSQVILDSLGNGVVATENGTKITVRNGQVVYDITGETGGEMAYNIMSTPNGRKAHLILSDGSQVWLNAGSSIRYAVAFKGKKRLVELRGEAYFEIAKNESLPFIVKARSGTEVEVLGTSFNINSYENEPVINTTLLDGTVKVQKDNQPVILKPGQQAQIGTAIKVLEDADTEKAIAWKNGLFNFEDASLEEVMRQLVRWYDIEVVYKSGVPDIHFVGKMSMNLNLSGLIRALEASKVHVKREGERKLVVYP